MFLSILFFWAIEIIKNNFDCFMLHFQNVMTMLFCFTLYFHYQSIFFFYLICKYMKCFFHNCSTFKCSIYWFRLCVLGVKSSYEIDCYISAYYFQVLLFQTLKTRIKSQTIPPLRYKTWNFGSKHMERYQQLTQQKFGKI